MEFKNLFVIDLQERTVINPDSTVSHRALALEHAQDRLTFFLKELPSARIREAPQLPVVWQISRSLRNPRCKQQVQIPSLLIVLQGPVSYVSNQAVDVEGKPLQELISSRTHGYRSHDLRVRFEGCPIVLDRAIEKNSSSVHMLWRCGLRCGRRRKK